MKIAFLGVRVPGHLNPMTTLARKLKPRGHDVVFLSVPDTERFVRAAELPFIPFCENDFPVGSLAKSMAALSKLQEQAALEMAIKSVANTMESAFRNLPRTLRDTNVDALVLDESQRGLGAVPLHLGICLTSMSRTLSLLIFQGILQYVHLTGNMRRPRRHWPEIRQVCAAYCKPMSQ
jgi:zeaxanthin glucosyltransferase